MKKVKLLMILMCVLACLSGCTIDGDTVATITGNEAAKTKTTCRLKTKDNIQTKIVLRHDEGNIEGHVVWLDYFASYDSTIEERQTIEEYIDKKYPDRFEYLFDSTRFIEDTEYGGNGGVAGRDFAFPGFSNLRRNKEAVDYFQLTPELLEKEIMTYDDFIEHLETLGYTCK